MTWEIRREEVDKFVAAHPDVELWLTGLAAETRRRYVRALIIYTKFNDMTPRETLDLKAEGGTKAERLLDMFLTKVEGLSDATKRNAVVAIHSFYKHNYLDLASRSGYSKVRYVAANDQKCPTQEELRDMTRDAHIRNNAIINVISSGGFRIKTASLLVWGDFKELWTWDGETPIYVRVESKRLKGEGYAGTVEQHTFMTGHACEVLLRYAKWYRERRELTDDSPLFISLAANRHSKVFTALNKTGIWKTVKGLGDFKPHDLRRFAQTQLETARINPNWIKKMQGKKLRGEDSPYSRPKIEEMRKAFKDAERYVTLAHPQTQIDELERRKQTMRDSAAMIFRDAPDKLLEFQNLLKKTKTEQDLDDMPKWGPMAAEMPALIEVPKDDVPKYQKLGYVVVGDAYNGNVYMRL